MERLKVVRVTQEEFELSNGAVYPHMVPLEDTPTIEEFQATYDQMADLFAGLNSDESPGEHQQGVGHAGSVPGDASSVGNARED